jgi:hypothetical protein
MRWHTVLTPLSIFEHDRRPTQLLTFNPRRIVGPAKVWLFIHKADRFNVPVVLVVEPVGSPICPMYTASAPMSAASALAASAMAYQLLELAPSMNTCPITLNGLSGGPGKSSTSSTDLAGNET